MAESDADRLRKLQDLGGFLETQGSLDDNLAQLAAMTAGLLNAENCSIMLLAENDAGELRLRVAASSGGLPAAAYRENPARGEGISGHVVETGRPLLIEDIAASPFAAAARHPEDPRKSMVSAPITVNRKIIGAVNINGARHGRPFNLDDLSMIEVAALFIGRTIQVIQLQNLLNSRYAQLALAREADQAVGSAFVAAAHDPDRTAKILAKSFYRELSRAGFGSSQIITAATEIISEISRNISKHSDRLNR